MSRYYATHLFAVSKLAGISEFGGRAVTKGKVKILPNAIDAKEYSYNEKIRKEKRSQLRLKDDQLTICHIGRFHPQKNHKFLLDIFNVIRNKNHNARLILIGDGPLRKDIEYQISELGINSSVILTGIRNNVPQLLQAMDVLLFPSFFEGFGFPPLEAQCCGVPVICSNNSSLPEVAGEATIMIDPHKPDEIAESIKSILSNQELRENLVKKGLENSKKFSWKKTAQKTFTLFEKI